VTLAAFAAERRRVQHISIDSAARARAQRQIRRTPLLLSIDGTDEHTNTQSLHCKSQTLKSLSPAFLPTPFRSLTSFPDFLLCSKTDSGSDRPTDGRTDTRPLYIPSSERSVNEMNRSINRTNVSRSNPPHARQTDRRTDGRTPDRNADPDSRCRQRQYS